MITIPSVKHYLRTLFSIGIACSVVLSTVIWSAVAASGNNRNAAGQTAAFWSPLSDAELDSVNGKEETYCTMLNPSTWPNDGDCDDCVWTQAASGADPQCPATVKTYNATETWAGCEGEGCEEIEDFVIWEEWACVDNGNIFLNRCCQPNQLCQGLSQGVPGCFGVKCQQCTYDDNPWVGDFVADIWECP
jgi:hypothetical protein